LVSTHMVMKQAQYHMEGYSFCLLTEELVLRTT